MLVACGGGGKAHREVRCRVREERYYEVHELTMAVRNHEEVLMRKEHKRGTKDESMASRALLGNQSAVAEDGSNDCRKLRNPSMENEQKP